MEYLGYKERSDKAFIDWSQVSKNFADTLDKLESDRQQKRKDILDQNDAVQDTLANAPMSKNDSFQELIGDGTNQMKEQQFVLFNMMKAGKMDYNEYLRQTNNLKQGMNDLITLSAEFDKQYDEKMAAWQKGELRYKNVYDMVNDVEIFKDFTNGSLYVDNGSSRLYFAKRNEDGSINKQQLSSVANMKFELDKMEKVWKGDDTFVNDVAEKMTKTRIVDKSGRLQYIEGGIDQLGEKALRDDIKALLINDEHVADYLTRNMTGYEFTRDAEAAKRNPNLILETPSKEGIAGYSSSITDEQRELVVNDIYQRILSKVPRRETAKPRVTPRPPSPYDGKIATLAQKYGDKFRQARNAIERGDLNAFKNAMSSFTSKGEYKFGRDKKTGQFGFQTRTGTQDGKAQYAGFTPMTSQDNLSLFIKQYSTNFKETSEIPDAALEKYASGKIGDATSEAISKPSRLTADDAFSRTSTFGRNIDVVEENLKKTGIDIVGSPKINKYAGELKMAVTFELPDGKIVTVTSDKLSRSRVGGRAFENAQTLTKFLEDIYKRYVSARAGYK
jgi:hypothetical protein